MYSIFYTTGPNTPYEAFQELASRYGTPYYPNSSNPDKLMGYMTGGTYLVYINANGCFDGFDLYPDTYPEPWHYSHHPDIPIKPITSLFKSPTSKRRSYVTYT
jgi:hypothetical protein